MLEAETDRLDSQLDRLDPELARRVRQTIACRDTDALAKVPGAGQIVERDGVRVQVMHNGLVVEEGGYYGDWMAIIIAALRGHHEPQEELVFDAIVNRLAEDAPSTEHVVVEFGAFWAYYSLWACRALVDCRAYGIEPDPAYLEVGRRNVALNRLGDRIVLEPGVVGSDPGATAPFTAESDGLTRQTLQYDLASLMATRDLDRVDLVLIDIQGWELLLLERALPLLRAGSVRFLLVSTHHHSISGDPLTHQSVLDLLVQNGATVLAEHTVGESASGDGLIAVSFDARDIDMSVAVSRVRARDSLYGELEYELAAAHTEVASLRRHLEAQQVDTMAAHEAAESSHRELEVQRARADKATRRARRLRRRLYALEAGAASPAHSWRERVSGASRRLASAVRSR